MIAELATSMGEVKHIRINKVSNAPQKIWQQIIAASIFKAALNGKKEYVYPMTHLSKANKTPPFNSDNGVPQVRDDWKIENGDVVVHDDIVDVTYALREFDRELYPFLLSQGFEVEIRSTIHQGMCLHHSYDGHFVIKWK